MGNKLPDRKILLKKYEIILSAIIDTSSNPRLDTLCFMAGALGISVKKLKTILFD